MFRAFVDMFRAFYGGVIFEGEKPGTRKLCEIV